MKNCIVITLAMLLWLECFSQQMFIKTPNYSFFRQDEKLVTPVLEQKSSAEAKKHPEYGILPFNAQCKGCVELIDERTIDSRQYVDAYGHKHTYSQKSFFPLHYKNSENDVWHTIDFRLRPDNVHPGVYTASNQPVPTKYDANKRSTSVFSDGLEFEFDKNLTLYFFDDSVAYTEHEKADYSNFSIGEEGLVAKNIWPGIEMTQAFNAGKVETSYLIRAPLKLPVQSGWMVIEDHFTLPEGITINEAPDGTHSSKGYYSGNYILKNANGDTVFIYGRSAYFDARAFGMRGSSKLVQKGRECSVQTLVPVSWLANKDNQYPICIDPTTTGVTIKGRFVLGAGNPAGIYFTTVDVGPPCTYPMTVTMRGLDQPIEAYVDLEYSLTHQMGMCDGQSASFCTFSQVKQEVVNSDCGTSSGPIVCDEVAGFLPASGMYSDYCTTDSSLVPGAHSILINNFAPGFLSCDPAVCPQNILHFELQNSDSICGDSCGGACANCNLWQMTIVGAEFTPAFVPDIVSAAPGATATFNIVDSFGVGPYTYQWTYNGNTVTNDSNTYSVTAVFPDSIICFVTDACGDTGTIIAYLRVSGPPFAEAGGPDTVCNGGTVTLGGNLTPATGDTITWTGENGTVQSWLSSDSIYHPTATLPAGTIGTYYYVLVVADTSGESAPDTFYVYSFPPPTVSITGDTVLGCANDTTTLTATSGLQTYMWNTGSNDSSILVTQPGAYYVIITENGCTDTSSTTNVTQQQLPTIQVFPDTTIHYGDSVQLQTTPNLTSVGIDSFIWYSVAGVPCDSCISPYVKPFSNTYYGVHVYSYGCEISDSVLIQVILPTNYFIPNVFSPNGDGNNDYFFIEAQAGVTVESFEVYNRIGEKVHDGQFPWDGNYKGKPAPLGTYAYVFKLVLFGSNASVVEKGSVTLFR